MKFKNRTVYELSMKEIQDALNLQGNIVEVNPEYNKDYKTLKYIEIITDKDHMEA